MSAVCTLARGFKGSSGIHFIFVHQERTEPSQVNKTEFEEKGKTGICRDDKEYSCTGTHMALYVMSANSPLIRLS